MVIGDSCSPDFSVLFPYYPSLLRKVAVGLLHRVIVSAAYLSLSLTVPVTQVVQIPVLINYAHG